MTERIKSEIITVNTIPGTIDQDEAYNIVARHSENYIVQVQKVIYYPYYWVFFSYTVKTLFGKSRETNASCLVDLINNHAATTDKFVFEPKELHRDSVLENDYSPEQALETARTYLTHASIHDTKILFAPDYEIRAKELVYKPFWIVKCSNREKFDFRVIVDAVTGKFQLL